MNKLMKAAVLLAPYKLVITDVEKPKAGYGEVLLEVKATGICGTDLETYKGKYQVKYPLIIGHEAAGEVFEVGEGVDKVQVGDRVVINPIFYCGKCALCLANKRNLCLKGGLLGRDLGSGTYAEYTVIPEYMLFKIPPNIPYEDATVIQLLTTVYHGQTKIKIMPGNSVAILGQGAAGLLHTRLAKLSGAKPILVTARSDWKLELARKFGADVTINSKDKDPVEQIRSYTNGLGTDVVIDAVGSHETLKQAIEAVRPGGKVLLFGVYTENIPEVNLFSAYFKEIDLIGTRASTGEEFEPSIKLVSTGAVDVKSLITHIFSLEKITEGFTLLEKSPGTVLRAIVKI